MLRTIDDARTANGSMQSLHLARFWSWLPAFRVVAERESLQEASRLLALSPSAISRTIRLLEKELGRALFTRESGRMELLPAGREFLSFVRRSMRLVDDGAAGARGSNAGTLRLALPRSLVSLVAIPALARWRSQRTDRTATSVEHDADARALVAGFIDLLITPAPAPAPEIEIHAIGEIELGVYCGREHPLWGAGSAPIDELVRHPFVSTEDALEVASWPPERARVVAVRLPDLSFAVDACVASLGLAVLPRGAARVAVVNRTLRCLDASSLAAVRLYAVRRPRLGDPDRVDRLVEALALTLRGLAHAPGAGNATRQDGAEKKALDVTPKCVT